MLKCWPASQVIFVSSICSSRDQIPFPPSPPPFLLLLREVRFRCESRPSVFDEEEFRIQIRGPGKFVSSAGLRSASYYCFRKGCCDLAWMRGGGGVGGCSLLWDFVLVSLRLYFPFCISVSLFLSLSIFFDVPISVFILLSPLLCLLLLFFRHPWSFFPISPPRPF